MFYLSPEGDRYYLGRAFTYDGSMYGSGAANHDKFIELGFTAVTIEQRPDDAYYFVSGPDSTGAYTATPRDLDQLKVKKIMEQKLAARQYMSSSDWYVIRNAELEIEVPAEWTAYRANVRAVADLRCYQIAAVTTVAELESLFNEPAEVSVDSDTAPEGYVMIDNPEPHLESWPEGPTEEKIVATDYDLTY